MSSKKLKIGIIAAEHSGDRLGANLIKALKNLDEVEVEVFGLGGPEVSSLGISTPNGMKYQDLQVMGLVDPLLKLPKLLSIRKKLTALFLNDDSLPIKAATNIGSTSSSAEYSSIQCAISAESVLPMFGFCCLI